MSYTLCVCNGLCVCEFTKGKKVARKAIWLCAILLKIIHPCFQVVTSWIVSLSTFSETNSKFVFNRHRVCLWPPVIDFIYVYMRHTQNHAAITSSTSLQTQWDTHTTERDVYRAETDNHSIKHHTAETIKIPINHFNSKATGVVCHYKLIPVGWAEQDC